MKLVYHFSGHVTYTPTPIYRVSPWQQSCTEFTHSDAPEMEPEERVSHAGCFLIWLWRRSRGRELERAEWPFFKNSAVAKIVLHELLSREIRQSLMLRADLLLLLHSCNGLVSYFVRTRDQQVKQGNPCLNDIVQTSTDLCCSL